MEERYSLPEITKTLGLLDWDDAFCYEVRVLGPKKHLRGAPRFKTGIGRFDREGLTDLVREVTSYSGFAEGVYLLPNPLPHRLLHRYRNRIEPFAETGAEDTDVVRRDWVLVDLDVTKPKGLGATDAEHEQALSLGKEVAAWCRTIFNVPVVRCDSGNGCHVLVRAPLSEGECQALLGELCDRFTRPGVRVDTCTYNRARITKFYGTLVCKGDPHPTENPHRMSRILEE